MSDLDVREAVYVQANMHMGGFSPVEEVALQQGVAFANSNGFPNAIVGWAPMFHPDEAKHIIE
eukprot:scaffold176832_cov46-Prasinocladus_malaysianus.AAC.1